MSNNNSIDKQPKETYRQLGPVTLAFMGDAVYEQLVREYLIRNRNLPAYKLHKEAVEYVNASAQAHAVEFILPLLTSEEQDILRRGRNANNTHVPKNADPLDYRHATGFEALFGYLFLCGENERIKEIFDVVVKEKESNNEKP